MSETKTLWQRCEALGRFEDYKDDHVEMLFASGRGVIRHDGQCILFIYEDKVRGSEWLADAILCYIERLRFPMPTITPLEEMSDDEKAAFMKAMSEWTCGPMTFAPNESVVTMQNINEKLREAVDSGQYDHDTDGRHRDPNFNGVPLDSVPLPIPNQLPDVTYVVEAPKEDSINGTRYRMCKDQPAQIDCRVTKCRFYAGAGTCINVSPALVLNQDSSFWCKSLEPKDEQVVEAPKPTEPTQEQLKAIWDYVTHLTGEQAESFGFQYAVIGNAAQANFELHIKSLGSRFGEWQIKIMHGHIGRYWWESPFSIASAATMLRMPMTIPTEQWVFEEPEQFVSIPVTEWQKLREAHKTIQSILFPEIKDVEFES